MVACVNAGLSTEAFAFCLHLAAVLKQMDVRARDISLWGNHWMSAAIKEPFLEVGHHRLR